MQLSVTITSLAGVLVIQDPHPVNGIFSQTVPAGGSKNFTCTWDVWHRISTKVEAYRAAGLCTVAMAEVTPVGTDGTAGPNTTYNRADWAMLNSFRHDIGVLQTAVTAIGSPLIPKGFIAVNTAFPLVAAVQSWWFYLVTADVTDNAGATYTNTGQSFLAGQEIAWNGTNWTVIGANLTNPLQYKGTIANAAGFPVPTGSAGVKSGHLYTCSAAVTDNDATKTNTGQVFRANDEIFWNGTNWTVVGAGATPQFTSVTMRQRLDHPVSGANYTIDWALAQHHHLTLTATCTLALTNPPGPANYTLKVIQGGAGGWGLNWPAATIFAGKVAPIPTAAAGSSDVFSVYFDGTDYHVGVAMADCGVAP